MAEGHGRDEWGRLSVLCALIGNAHRDPKKGRAFKPGDFDPYDRPHSGTCGACGAAGGGEVIEVNRENIGTLKQAFVQQQGRKGT